MNVRTVLKCVTVQPCAGLNEKVCCKLACISVFLHKLVYRVTVAMHLEKTAGGRFCRCQSMQEKLPVASPLYHAIVKSFRLSKRLQECIELIEINKVYKKYDKKSFLVCKM